MAAPTRKSAKKRRSRSSQRPETALPDVPGARPGALPRYPVAQLATLVAAAPVGDDWLHELKFDGFRLLARLESGHVELWTRNGKDWTDRFGAVAQAIAALPVTAALLDGEVVVQLPDGRTSFQALQNAAVDGRGELLYYAFDLLHVDGLDLAEVSQESRKELLRSLVGALPEGPVRFSDHVVGRGPEFFAEACSAGVEGIISKLRSAPYRPGRTRGWVKVKCVQEQEFVVAGYTDPSGSREGFGALVLGVWDEGSLRYAGKVGTGFTSATLRQLKRKLGPLERSSSPLRNPPRGAQARGIHWLEPTLVAQVAFTERTADGILRHPSFKGLREDKPAAEVVLETPSRPGASDRPRAGGRASRRGKPEVEIAGVRLSSPDRILYPDLGLTKLDLAEYYAAVEAFILPHLADRPLTLVRCPSGQGGECFFQKHMDEIDSPHVRKIRVKESAAARDYGSVSDLAGILTAVQLGTLEFHTWNSRADRLEKPDRMIIDLDPDTAITWDQVIEAAHEVRLVLGELGLESFVKTTGGKGLHVVVPLTRRGGWEELKEFAQGAAGAVARARPDRYTLQLSKARRKGRLLLDYLRNARGATAVEVYSTRARAGGTVSTPITWEEVAAGVRPEDFTIRTVPARLRSVGDVWQEYGAVRQSLTAPMRKRLGLGRR
ncbi:MAG TPA: DNA ligase D [Longimicrobiales bacterium]|nr:DNA ligase D [Longimicrobiales bacterium]